MRLHGEVTLEVGDALFAQVHLVEGVVEVQQTLTHQGEVTVPEAGEAVPPRRQLHVLVHADGQQVEL